MNVRGLVQRQKRQQVFQWLKNQNCSFYMLQETHLTKKYLKFWKQDWQGDIYYSGCNQNSEGVCILINPKLKYTIQDITEIVTGRVLACSIIIENNLITLINIYGPNKDEEDVFEKLNSYISQRNDQNFIIGGDFNTVLNASLDKRNGRTDTNKKCRNKITQMMQNNDLIDIWRECHKDKKQFTWHSNTKPTIHSRLDYFLISNNIKNTIKSCNIKLGFKTDHHSVTLTIDSCSVPRGPGYFKLNNSILIDQEYHTKIKQTIITTVNENKECNPNTLWEVLKGNIRNETIKYTSYKAKLTKKTETELIDEISRLEKLLTNKNIPVDELNEIINNIDINRDKLDIIETNKINGILIRSKAEFIEHNERNTKYFSNLEKHKSQSKTIYKLIDNDIEFNKSEDILNVARNYFQKLYTKQNPNKDKQTYVFDPLHKLNEDDKNNIEGKLNDYECFKALDEMETNKSPGSDGLSVEFYKIFWKELKQYFLKSINYSFENNHLTDLQKQGIITLLPKPGKDLKHIANWRPISLLNIDYKIATKAIANRIKTVLQNIISPNQTGFIKNRYIGENIQIILKIIDLLNKKKLPGLIMFADFEKAFDSLKHQFIFDCFQKFNFGNDICKWVHLFYNDISSIIINNGNLSESFNITRGVRQGCPLSSIIFIICIETLSNNIETNPNIKGIKVGNEELKQTLFADDATYFNNGDEESLKHLLETLEQFSNVSGLNLNINKTTFLRVGSLKNTNTIFFPHKKFLWTNISATTLGMQFFNDLDMTIKQNLEKKVVDFKNCLKQWQHRKLTLMGKVIVIKSFALPKLIYPLSILPNPHEKELSDINRTIFQFIWDNKPDKIKRDVLKMPFDSGGLNVPNIFSYNKSLKIAWIKRYLDTNNKSIWKNILQEQLAAIGENLIFETNTSKNDLCKICKNDKFLIDIINSWYNVKKEYNEKNNINNKHIIWHNSDIKIGNKTIFYPTWLDKGIKYIEHLFDFRTKTFYTFNDFKHIYNIETNQQYQYLQLIHSIPVHIKQEMKTIDINRYENNDNSLLKKLTEMKKVNKYLGSIQQNTNVEKINERMWNNTLNTDNIDWKKIYKIPFKTTNDTSLQNFQYKINLGILPTNSLLLKYNLKNTDICDQCQTSKETLFHLFWECQVTQTLWNNLQDFLKTKNITVRLTPTSAILGTSNELHQNIKNYLFILMKRFIYLMKINQRYPTFVIFLNYLREKLKTEKLISISKNRFGTHIDILL